MNKSIDLQLLPVLDCCPIFELPGNISIFIKETCHQRIVQAAKFVEIIGNLHCLVKFFWEIVKAVLWVTTQTNCCLSQIWFLGYSSQRYGVLPASSFRGISSYFIHTWQNPVVTLKLSTSLVTRMKNNSQNVSMLKHMLA